MTLDITRIVPHIVTGSLQQPLLIDPLTMNSPNQQIRGAWATLNNGIAHQIDTLNAEIRDPYSRWSTITPSSALLPADILKLLITATRQAAATQRFTTGAPAELTVGAQVRIIATPDELSEIGIPRQAAAWLGTIIEHRPGHRMEWVARFDYGPGHTYSLRATDLEVVTPEPAQRPFEIGSRVRYIGDLSYLDDWAVDDPAIIAQYDAGEIIAGRIIAIDRDEPSIATVSFDASDTNWDIHTEQLEYHT